MPATVRTTEQLRRLHRTMTHRHRRRIRSLGLEGVLVCFCFLDLSLSSSLGSKQKFFIDYFVRGQELTCDYEHAPFPPPGVPLRSQSDYLLVRRLGAGKFSDVFEAVDEHRCQQLNVPIGDVEVRDGHEKTLGGPGVIDPRTLVVLKCLKPIPVKKIKREIVILQHVSKLPNLARLLALVVPSQDSSTPHSATGSTTNSDVSTLTTDRNSPSHEHWKEYQQIRKTEEQIPPMPSLVLEHGHGDWLCHPMKLNEAGASNNFSENNAWTTMSLHDENGAANENDNYLSPYEVRYYMYHLLVALDQLHSHGIMHRDVKPRNVLIDRRKRSLMLIDLGLADFYKPNLPYNVRVASRHYKAPELLLGYQGYDFSLDIWGFGCILAGLLFYKEPFFRGRDNVDQLATIVHVLGTADLHRYMITYSIPMTQDIRRVIAEYKIQGGTGYAKDWREFIQNENVQKGSFSSSPSASLSRGLRPRPPPPPPSPEGIDLLSKILRYNHKERLSAREAMAHAYFDPVRMTVERQLYNQNQN